MAGDETVLAAAACEVIYGFLDGFCYGTHCDDYVLCGGVTVVLEGTVTAACEFRDLTHIAGYDIRNCRALSFLHVCRVPLDTLTGKHNLPAER